LQGRDGAGLSHALNQYINSTTYLGNIDDVAFHNLEQGMLDSLTTHIAANAYVAPRFTDLIGLVDVNDTPLASFNVLATLEV
jgi:hypothetical protein